MKRIVLAFVCLLCRLPLSAQSEQSNFEKRYDNLLGYLSSENWGKSTSLAKELLTNAEKAKGRKTEVLVLRYIYIYANAGLLSEKKISGQEALKSVLFLKGKRMTMPAHPFNSKCFTNCTNLDKDGQFFTGVNNSNGTTILAFEHVKPKDLIKVKRVELEGKNIALSGVLNDIKVEGSIFPRFNMHFTDGEYTVVE